jgi:DNA-binding NtrC family response regulator
MLERRFDFDFAVGANAALEVLAARGPFAVIVTDLRMPGMSGIELLSRAQKLSPHTVGLLLSGGTHSDETDDATRKGIVFRLIEKPCESARLIEAIVEALARHERMIQVTA